MPYTPVFLARLKGWMSTNDITQKILAERLEVSLSTAKRICSKGLAGSHASIFAVAKAVGCSGAYLQGERDTPERPVYLTEDQRILLELYERLTTAEKRAAMNTLQIAHKLTEKEKAKSS